MSKPHLSSSLHLHDAPITCTWVEDPGSSAGGFVTIKMHDFSVLVFNEEQAHRVVIAGADALRLFILNRKEQEEKEKTYA